MSGTSMDGIDAVLVSFAAGQTSIKGHIYLPWAPSLREELRRLSQPGDNEIDRLGCADIEVATQFSKAVLQLLNEACLDRSQIKAIGSHGQTIRHRPDARRPFTLQIGDPNLLAEQTGITVVADFRRRDMAAGGQGAPLAPAFHADRLHAPSEQRVILNLGGIANITILPKQLKDGVIGFDTGPANTLMDAWIMQCHQTTYDKGGEWAASGTLQPELLNLLLRDAYFTQAAPKSTGPERFNLSWLKQQCPDLNQYKPEDIQATLLALTVETIASAIEHSTANCDRIICCGGGTQNSHLMQQLQHRLADTPIETTSQYGISPDQIEATAFAWLAHQTLEGLNGNLPSVTGAAHPVILGGVYHA
ncbi:MAG: anhydro-N-acetylmuramic acid kinase, partial [Sedimenticola sp.]|nr:anhydro-N-acetylmuramic acid kinase [Sedimenticola sp.]